MDSNPILEKQKENQKEEEERKKKELKYPIRVTCIFLNYENNNFPIIREVQEYCNKCNIAFSARQYNSDKYEEDILIKRLPAFHLVYKGEVDETTYFDTNPVHRLQRLMWEYEDEEKARLKRQQKWDRMVSTIKGMFVREKKTNLVLENCLVNTPTSSEVQMEL